MILIKERMMAILIDGEWHLIRGDVCFIVYPFGVNEYDRPSRLAAAIAFFYSRGVIPLLSPTIFHNHQVEIIRRRIVKKIIAKADAAVIIGEESITYNMLLELVYCRELEVPIFRIHHSP